MYICKLVIKSRFVIRILVKPMKIFKTISVFLATCYMLLATKLAFAVDVGVSVAGKSSFKGYNEYINYVLKYAVRLGFVLAILMLIYAGIKYMTSQGNQTQINDAKEIMLGAIIGFVMLLLVNVILGFLGIGALKN